MEVKYFLQNIGKAGRQLTVMEHMLIICFILINV